MESVRIFISYAREDKDEVRNIYRHLEEAGFQPWMDEKDIVAGSLWRGEIEKALRQCDFFLLCLSSRSANKRGFIQREIRYALDLCQEKLQDDIYIIPVRLEDCEAPDSVSDFQWLDWFEEDSWDDLSRSLHAQMKRLGKTTAAAPLPSLPAARQAPAKTPPSSPLHVQSVPPPLLKHEEQRVGKIYESEKRVTTQPAQRLPLPPPPRTTETEFATFHPLDSGTVPQRLLRPVAIGTALAISIIGCIGYLIWGKNRSTVDMLRYELYFEANQANKFKFRITTRADGYLYLFGLGEQNQQPIVFLTNQPPEDCGKAKNRVQAGFPFVFPCGNNWFELLRESARFTLIYSPTDQTNLDFLNASGGNTLSVNEQWMLDSLRKQSAHREPNIIIDRGFSTVRARATPGGLLLVDFNVGRP